MKTPTKSKQVSKVKTMTRLEAANKINKQHQDYESKWAICYIRCYYVLCTWYNNYDNNHDINHDIGCKTFSKIHYVN